MTVTQWAGGFTAYLGVVCFSLPALGQSPDSDKALASLIHQLSDEDDDIRMAAVKQIHEMGTKIIPKVLSRMDDPNANLRHGVALVVRRFGADSVPYLTALATGSDSQKQLKAIELLDFLNEKSATAIPVLVKLTNHENVKVRAAVADALGSTRDA